MDAAAMHAAMPYALLAVIIALAIAVAAIYARYTRVLRACRQEHGCGARREESTGSSTWPPSPTWQEHGCGARSKEEGEEEEATSAEESRRQEEDGGGGGGGGGGGDSGDIGTAAPAEAEIGSSGTFADLCADGEASR